MKDPLQSILDDAVDETYDERLTDEQRQKIANSLMSWVRDYARKRPLPDLAARLDRLQEAVEKMVLEMDIVTEQGKFVVSVHGSDEDTWRRLRLGTDWFEGTDKLMDWVMAGVADDSPSS